MVDFVVDLPVPVGNIPVEGCPEPPLGGCASYCHIDYRGGDCQSVDGCRNYGNRDYFGSHDNSMVHRGRNPYSSGGDPDDSANARSCGVIDWGSKGARHDIGFPDCNMSCQRYPSCCNVVGFLPMAVSPLCSVGVVAPDWDEAQFGELGPCSFSSACYIRTGPPYVPVNGKWGNVSSCYNLPRNALSSSRLYIEWPGETNIPRSGVTLPRTMLWKTLRPPLLI